MIQHDGKDRIAGQLSHGRKNLVGVPPELSRLKVKSSSGLVRELFQHPTQIDLGVFGILQTDTSIHGQMGESPDGLFQKVKVLRRILRNEFISGALVQIFEVMYCLCFSTYRFER